MLMQSFKSAAELKLTEEQYDALKKVLVLLETGQMTYAKANRQEVTPLKFEEMEFTGHFNMGCWTAKHECGTIACIGGTAELLARKKIFGGVISCLPSPLHALFYPPVLSATVEQAARALRNYLNTGDADWRTVLTS